MLGEAERVSVVHGLGWIAAALALAGCAYSLLAAHCLVRLLARPAAPAADDWPAISILKPLLGAFPGLDRALDSYAAQDYQGPIQIIIGIRDAADPAVAIARRFQQSQPDLDVQIVVDAAMHGVNGKISNLMNMMPCASGKVLVMSDADVEAAADYLSVLARELAVPDVGAATCLYRGRGAAGVWSVSSAMGVDSPVAPSAALGAGLGLAAPCLGPTIAVRSEVMRQIGGLAPFANLLAEDYAIGAAVRSLGLKLIIPPVAITHLCDEASLSELIGHELRWARTIEADRPRRPFRQPGDPSLRLGAAGGPAHQLLELEHYPRRRDTPGARSCQMAYRRRVRRARRPAVAVAGA